MIIHSDECQSRWEMTVGKPGPTPGAWHFTCTNGCHATHIVAGRPLWEDDDPPSVFPPEHAERLDRAFGEIPDHK